VRKQQDARRGETVAILEDDPDRIGELAACLRDELPDLRAVVFDNAPDMIDWLAEHTDELRLICLDHDLGPNRLRGHREFDPGTGRDVADYLAKCRCICPVLIHTTNSLALPGMEMVLDDACWVHSHVMPYNGLEWVREAWIEKVVELLAKVPQS
jgi:hypothetical protein